MQQKLTRLLLSLVAVLFCGHAKATEENGRPGVFLRVGKSGFESSWLTLGPLKEGAAEAVEEKYLKELGKAVPTEGDRTMGKVWTVSHFSSFDIDFAAKKKSAVFLFAQIVSDAEQQIWMSTGSNGPIRARLEKKVVLSKTLSRKSLPDTDLTALPLVKGVNNLLIVLENLDERRLRGSIRLMNEDFSAADTLGILIPGKSTSKEILKKKGSFRLIRKVNLQEETVTVQSVLAFPGGRPVLADGKTESFALLPKNDAALEERAIDMRHSAEAEPGLFVFNIEHLPLKITASLLDAEFSCRVDVESRDVRRLAEAHGNLTAATAAGPVEKTTLESLLWRIEHLTSLIEAGDKDRGYIEREIRNTLRMTRSLKEGKDPYFNRRDQVQRRGYRSSVDGSLQPYVLYVPPGWKEEDDKKFAIVIALHGLNSGPMKALKTVLGIAMREGETKRQMERSPAPAQRVPMFVLAPFGFGNSGYRTFGEVDVLEALAQVTSRYRIHPDRVYITGASMGGIGAASLPLHFPDRFAAAAPLCGYHSMFLYRGVTKKPLRPFERFLLESRSNAYWAPGGRYVPMYIVHGLKDRPAQSKVLVKRYKDLKYDMLYETPDLEHNVWDSTYQNKRIFAHFRPYRRKARPRRVNLHTASLRYASSYYLRVDAMESYGEWATVDADWQKDNTIALHTRNVAKITVRNDEELRGDGPLTVSIDDTSLDVSETESAWTLAKGPSGWAPVERNESVEAPETKRNGMSGPIWDAQHEPLLFVYGTQDKAEENLSKRLARNMASSRPGVTVHREVKADRDVTEEDIASKSLAIIGTPKGNSLLCGIARKLPIRVSNNAIVAGKKRLQGIAPAAAFIYPNPLNPKRYVVVYTGVSAEALFYVNHLPQMLPDYIVFDGPKWAFKGGRILNGRQILDAGFFDGSWAMRKSKTAAP